MVLRKKNFKKILLAFFGIVLVFALSILADRFLGWILASNGYFKALQPSVTEDYNTDEYSSTAHISSQGLRNKEVAIPKPNNTFRILALGDSFTFGWGVNDDQTWPALLEEHLKNQTVDGKQIEVVNGGAYGASPEDIKQICDDYAGRLGVDFLIVSVYSLDDPYQAAQDVEQAKLDGLGGKVVRLWPTLTNLRYPDIKDIWSGAQPGETAESTYVWQKQAEGFSVKFPKYLLALPPDIRSAFLRGKLNPGLVISSASAPNYLVKIMREPYYGAAISAMADWFKELKSGCAKDIPALIVFLPSSDLVSNDYFPGWQALGYNIDDRLLTFNLDPVFGHMVRTNGFYYDSLLANFRQDGCPGCFYKLDSHLTPVGTKRVADFLAPEVVKLIRPGLQK